MSAFKTQRHHRGRLEQPNGHFVLRNDITQPGDYPLVDAIEDVRVDWERQAAAGTVAETTVATHMRVLRMLAKYAVANQVVKVNDLSSSIISSWINAPHARTNKPLSEETRRNRSTVAAQFFATCIRLGIVENTPMTAVVRAKKQTRHIRPFTQKEIDQLKGAARQGHRAGKSTSTVALYLLGAAPGEVGSITCQDIDLLNKCVRAHGGGERYRERYLPIDDDWAFDQLAARLKWLAQHHPEDWKERYVAYSPTPGSEPSFEHRCAAVSNTITAAMKRAQVHIKGETRAASISEYVAVRIFEETGRLEAVAARLGIRRLDDAAVTVGYDWRTKYAFNPYTEVDNQ